MYASDCNLQIINSAELLLQNPPLHPVVTVEDPAFYYDVCEDGPKWVLV
jgi:hypothetical protein